MENSNIKENSISDINSDFYDFRNDDSTSYRFENGLTKDIVL